MDKSKNHTIIDY